jgi:hypothetical protein
MLKAIVNFLKLKPRVTEQKDLVISQPTIEQEPQTPVTTSVETPSQEKTQTKPTRSKPTAKKTIPSSPSTRAPRKQTSPRTKKKVD